MRVVIAHNNQAGLKNLRQAVLGAGLDCAAADCVPAAELPVRLAHGEVDLVLVGAEPLPPEAWQTVQEAQLITKAPFLAVGPQENEQLASRAAEAGVVEYIPENNLRARLDDALENMSQANVVRARRGTVVSVYAPTPGSGGTTVACNLAGALAKKYPHEVALLELTRDTGDISLLLNMEPEFSMEDVCQRWETIDRPSVERSFSEHSSGLYLLANRDDQPLNEHLHANSVRRLLVLSRAVHGFSVAALDYRLDEEEVEAMKLSDTVVMVVRPDVPAVRRAQWAMHQAFERGVPPERFRLVVNRWGQGGQLSLKQIETTLGMKPLQLIPDDPGLVNKSANQGKLLQEVSWLSRISRRFHALAAAVNGRV